MARNRRGEAGVDALRGAFSAATMRALLGIVDTGRVLLARVKAPSGEPVVDNDGKDLLVRVEEVLHGFPLLARLHIPANMLWRKPRAEETLTVVVPADLNGPGNPLALYGDAGAADAVPPWIDSASGLYAPEAVRVESKDGDVVVQTSGSNKVKLGATATKGVTREGDGVDCGTLAFTFTPGMAATLSITYTPPAGMGTPTVLSTGTGSIALKGKVGTGSAKVKAED